MLFLLVVAKSSFAVSEEMMQYGFAVPEEMMSNAPNAITATVTVKLAMVTSTPQQVILYTFDIIAGGGSLKKCEAVYSSNSNMNQLILTYRPDMYTLNVSWTENCVLNYAYKQSSTVIP